MTYLVPSEQTLIETVGNIKYIGISAAGSLESDLVWRILRVTESNGVSYTEWANKTQSSIFSWTNRSSYFSAPPIDSAAALFPLTTKSSSFESAVFDISSFKGFAIETFWKNCISLDAIVSAKISIDGVNFSTHPDAQISITTDDSFMWNVEAAYYKYAKIEVNIVSGSGDFLIVANGKGF